MSERFQNSIDVNASAAECYACWRELQNLPRIMDHVKEVRAEGDTRYKWVVEGPLGKDLEWDAVIDGDEPGKLISWHTISDPDVGVQGAVRFDDLGADRCKVTVTMQYQPPAGPLGEAVAKIFANPQRMVDDDLNHFKRLVESGNYSRYAGGVASGVAGGYPDSGDVMGVSERGTGPSGYGMPGTDVNPPNRERF